MSRSRTVKGKYVKITNGDHNMSSEGHIISKAVLNVGEKGTAKGVTRNNYERLGSNVNEDFEITFSLEKGKTYSTLVPLGILDFEGKDENANFVFNYSLMLSNIDSLDFKILNEDGSTLYAVTNLPEVVISARRMPLLVEDIFKKKPKYDPFNPKNVWDWKSVFDPYNVSSNDYTKIGSYVILWDGFDNNEIYDSINFNNKKLKAQITARKNGKEKTKEVEFSTEQIGADWVDVKIDKKSKRIDTTLRVNLKDGGEEGLSCKTIGPNAFEPSMQEITVCDWDKIPKSEIKPNQPIKKTRTRTFEDLKQLALEGLNYHWGRNKHHAVAKDVKIVSDSYEVYIDAKATTEKAIGAMELIYNTNGDWMRSGNPGSIKDPMTAVGNLISRQAICYNVGYIEYSNGWGYSFENSEDEEFKETSAHEIGHEILKKYGGTIYSYGHKGSANSVFQYKYNDAPEIPLTGEIDLMPYFSDNALGGEHKQPNYLKRKVGAEKDVLGLIWLTKIEIK